MPSSANSDNLRTLWHAFRTKPIPSITLVDLRHKLTGERWPTICVLESHPDGDKLYPYAFMIDKSQHDLCNNLLIPPQYEGIWDWCLPEPKEKVSP